MRLANSSSRSYKWGAKNKCGQKWGEQDSVSPLFLYVGLPFSYSWAAGASVWIAFVILNSRIANGGVIELKDRSSAREQAGWRALLLLTTKVRVSQYSYDEISQRELFASSSSFYIGELPLSLMLLFINIAHGVGALPRNERTKSLLSWVSEKKHLLCINNGERFVSSGDRVRNTV